MVTINELILGVNIALGSAQLSACPAFDCEGNQMVPINCLIQGVNNAQSGCGGASSTPTVTPTNISTPTATLTQTLTAANTATATSTRTQVPTSTPTPTQTPTATATSRPTNTPTQTPTSTPTQHLTNTATNTPNNTATLTPTGSATSTSTNTPTVTLTDTPTVTPTVTPIDCTTDSDCLSGNYCEATGGATGTCQPQIGAGQTCATANCFVAGCAQCSSSKVCSRDHVCCDSVCNGACQTCTATLGTCTFITGAPIPATACNGSLGCSGTCDGTHTDCNYSSSDGMGCSFCGTCSGGKCLGGAGITCGVQQHCCFGCAGAHCALPM